MVSGLGLSTTIIVKANWEARLANFVPVRSKYYT